MEPKQAINYLHRISKELKILAGCYDHEGDKTGEEIANYKKIADLIERLHIAAKNAIDAHYRDDATSSEAIDRLAVIIGVGKLCSICSNLKEWIGEKEIYCVKRHKTHARIRKCNKFTAKPKLGRNERG